MTQQNQSKPAFEKAFGRTARRPGEPPVIDMHPNGDGSFAQAFGQQEAQEQTQSDPELASAIGQDPSSFRTGGRQSGRGSTIYTSAPLITLSAKTLDFLADVHGAIAKPAQAIAQHSHLQVGYRQDPKNGEVQVFQVAITTKGRRIELNYEGEALKPELIAKDLMRFEEA